MKTVSIELTADELRCLTKIHGHALAGMMLSDEMAERLTSLGVAERIHGGIVINNNGRELLKTLAGSRRHIRQSLAERKSAQMG